MKKLSIIAALLALYSCAKETPATTPPVNAEAALTVHYYRYDGVYDGWNLWVWPTGGEGKGFAFGDKDGDGFVTAAISAEIVQSDEYGVIVRRSEPGNDWAEKDTNPDRFTKAKEIWIMQGDETMYTTKPVTGTPPIQFAVADSATELLVRLMDAPDDYSVFAVYQGEQRLAGAARKGKTSKQVLITLDEAITDVSQAYVVRDESGKHADKPLIMRGILDSFYYNGADLGVSYAAAQSVFKLWAPTATTVSVALYDDAGVYNAEGKVTNHETTNLSAMTKDAATGVWSATVTGNLDGKYYLYRVEFADGTVNYAADPYAKAVSANGQRMAIVNLAATNPAAWQPAARPAFSGNMQDAVLYELHVRDFSIDDDSGMTNKGKFLAFTETATKNSAGAASGVDHLKALGITHVHLLPSFDFASLNELNADDPSSPNPKFNWGYDPRNYNVPEGFYSTNPRDPTSRIREFKAMVQALHNAGIRVVMDVVYNHTFETGGAPFDAAVPQYYYRLTDTGDYANGSGCGNEVASEHPMVRKFIVESCLYWAQEYGVDGFRFDLMGLIDVPTMEQITSELRSKVDPSIIIYGEPWQAGGSPLEQQLQTTKGKQKNKGFAVFNDNIRTAIKGDSDGAGKGFATGQAGAEDRIVYGVMGSVNDFTARASESINYVTAHDNLNLWDKIAKSLGASDLKNNPYSLIDPSKPLFDNAAVKSVLLVNGIIFTAQGIPFFQAGDEFLRSKFGDHNSYASPDAINRIRWENASLYSAVTDYYAGLIALRRAHPAFRMDTKADIERHLEVLEQKNCVVSFVLKDNANGDAWKTIFVAYNANSELVTLTLPENGAWSQVVDAFNAGTSRLNSVEGTVTLPGLSMAVLYQ
ncbi:MAG: type I pullulanase [Treponema sp.]|jgi:pullulanase|nr:type I pullulanase [Treponema sp.]